MQQERVAIFEVGTVLTLTEVNTSGHATHDPHTRLNDTILHDWQLGVLLVDRSTHLAFRHRVDAEIVLGQASELVVRGEVVGAEHAGTFTTENRLRNPVFVRIVAERLVVLAEAKLCLGVIIV